METLVEASSELRSSELGAVRYRNNALISLGLFLAAAALVYRPEVLDYPFTRFLNSFADRDHFLEVALYSMYSRSTFSGVMLMSLVWWCWSGTQNLEMRARIVVGTVASFGAGVLSRFLQHALKTHPRPMYDPAIRFHLPAIFGYHDLNTWNSFPSDHGTVFAGLALVVFLTRSRLGWFAVIWTFFVELARTYEGSHYPTDLLGGAALAGIIVWGTQAPWAVALGLRVVRWGQRSPRLFYAAAFFVCYQIATLFVDIRGLVK